MILELVLSEISQPQANLRHLVPFEELLWQMDKRSPLRATLATHIDGSTLNGRLCLLHTSHRPLPGFLAQIESILTRACVS